MEDIQFSREFQWEHCNVADTKAIKVYTTNTSGDDIEFVLDYDSMEDLMEGLEYYLGYLREKE